MHRPHISTFPEESPSTTPDATTRRGITFLTFAFILSQFYRSCLAVIAPELQHDFQLSPAGYGALSSCFFLAFAVAQIPVGLAFDRFGVGRPTAWLLGVGAVSGIALAAAPNATVAMLAQMGLGLACAPVFMGLLHYASEQLSEKRVHARGQPLQCAGHGWRAVRHGPAGLGLAACGLAAGDGGYRQSCMAAVCYGVWRVVRDEGHAEARNVPMGAMLTDSARLLGMGSLWLLIPMCVAMAAGTAFRTPGAARIWPMSHHLERRHARRGADAVEPGGLPDRLPAAGAGARHVLEGDHLRLGRPVDGGRAAAVGAGRTAG